jgi:nucleoside-diphosphate-sugar epimerase/carbamoylphosphate synthase large subunit
LDLISPKVCYTLKIERIYPLNKIFAIKVGVTCIGSGVGQSIAHSCRLSRLPLQTYGLGTNPLAYGAFDCDHADLLPSIYSDEYAGALFDYCVKNQINILIPGLDDELPIFCRNEARFLDAGIAMVVTSAKVVSLCRDKLSFGRSLASVDKFFMRSYSTDEAIHAVEAGEIAFPLLAKPRSGCASRNICIIRSHSDFKKIDDRAIIQQIAYPRTDDPNYDCFAKGIEQGVNTQVSEISFQAVVGAHKNTLGMMTTCNKLKDGVPIEAVPYYDETVQDSINEIMDEILALNHKGPINIQGRLTDQGPKFFEINARFTGLTGMRAMWGFNEVEAVIRDILRLDPPAAGLSFNANRLGIRQVADRLVDVHLSAKTPESALSTLSQIKSSKDLVILITGANGALGRSLIADLQKCSDVAQIVAAVRNPSGFILSNNNKISVIDINSLFDGSFSFGLVDCIYHLAFTRQSSNTNGLTESLAYTDFIMRNAALFQIETVINVSSQSIYGQSRPPLWSESIEPRPENAYSLAKYAAELLTGRLKHINHSSKVVNVRLSTLTGIAYPESVLYKFAQRAFIGKEIEIVGGDQTMDILDVRDASFALAQMLNFTDKEWKPIYNLGSGESIGITEFVDAANNAASALNLPCAPVILKPTQVHFATGMDISSFNRDFNWCPQISLTETYQQFYAHFSDPDQRIRTGVQLGETD